MSTDLKRRNVPFSPPDMTEAEASEVRDMDFIRTGRDLFIARSIKGTRELP